MEGRKQFYFHGRSIATLVIFLTYLALSSSLGFCPPGEYYYPGDRSCIRVEIDFPATWNDARAACQADGGDLVKVPDEAFNEFLLGILQVIQNAVPGYWIGLQDKDTDGVFSWLDEDTEPTFTYWDAGSPNIYTICVGYYPNTIALNWKGGDCSGPQQPYLCQKPSSSSGNLACREGWQLYSDHGKCFRALDGLRTEWYGALVHCFAEDSRRAEIINSGVNDFVKSILSPDESYWISLNDNVTENHFKWSQGFVNTTFSFFDGPGFDNQFSKNCVMIESSTDHYWNMDRCENNHTVLCERWAEPLYKACSTGEFYYPEDQTCISLHQDEETWTDARDVCQGDGNGDLVKLSDFAINEFFIGIVQRAGSGDGDYWIGLNDRDEEGHFRWLDEENDASFASWFHNEPNNGKGNEHCVHGSAGKNYRWNDRNCDKPTSFACQKPNSVPMTLTCAPGTGDWHHFARQGRCFKVMNGDMLNWTRARETCVEEGGDLAAITSYDLNEFLIEKLSLEGDYWIGLSDQQTEGQFSWLDATPKTSFTFWKRHEPNNGRGEEDCVRIQHRSNFQWNDARCDKLSWFICERPAELQA